MIRKRLTLLGLCAIIFAVATFFSIRISETDKAAAQDNQTFWNVTSLEQAAEIPGYEIAIPTFVPEDFKLASKIMVSITILIRLSSVCGQWREIIQPISY